ncbi:MAG: peptidoglycan-binding protein, partial [Devosia sp.]
MGNTSPGKSPMRIVVVIFFGLFLAFSSFGPAAADFDQSKAWFETLSADERTETQANLILLGYYQYLVDGQFGTGTYQALVAFQKSQGRAATGALIEKDRQKLLDLAAQVYSDLGMDLVRDEEGQAALILPAGLLSVRKAAERGNTYTTPDGGVVLETTRSLGSERSFAALYEKLKTPGQGRFILYSNYNDDRFVISGKQDGLSFYSMFQNAETESVGYTLTWTEAYDEQASMLSIFIASHFAPLRFVPPEEGAKVMESPMEARQFGVFELPENAPDTIILNGEVTHTLASDFDLALAARPSAKVLLLNSPGGYVDNALVVAHEVRRRGMTTLVDEGMGCYSACSYIFFAGRPRQAIGELGVHQISAEVADLVLAQTTLSDVLDALDQFGVEQVVITRMLRTPPEDMYVFSPAEIAELSINQGGDIQLADVPPLRPIGNEPVEAVPVRIVPPEDEPAPTPRTSEIAYVQLSMQSSEDEASRSLAYAQERWAGVLGNAVPQIERTEGAQGLVFRVRVPARSLENANAICAAIKKAGGGCYVTSA